MSGSLNITAATVEPGLLALPWDIPLENWPDDTITALPKGISRHIVRFAQLDGYVIAIKETTDEMAQGEYDMLRNLQKIEVPCVEPVAVIQGRTDIEGNPLPSALVTRHLKFSMPFRALYSTTLRPETAQRLVDSLALLLVRLHNVGFFWGDVSLSNTLFRRDAGSFAAYLVDAETGRLYDSLTKGQREHDLEIARVNIAGELMDIQAGGKLDAAIDPVATSDRIMASYDTLWHELNDPELLEQNELWKINKRVQRLNDLGFDIEELSIKTDADGTKVKIQPKVVDSGHHARRLLRLTGLDTEENQARRLLNDLDSYAATVSLLNLDEEVVAHLWLTRVFEPVIRAVPENLDSKLEPAEVFHQVLEHRWFMSQEQARDVPLNEAVRDYIENVLQYRRDEEIVINPPTGTFTAAVDIIRDEDDFEYNDEPMPPRGADEPIRDWRDLV
ncbi:hypothetical protein M2116_001647 [Aurantimicrobium minutum]|uniref:DUF4032 domain-containing protein n=1 Tax=Aurantimicrobium minutum TaxID=708131 RepID=UPI002404D69D|nr:DUF4032 domain-containing protein [Aurantimicrobium minutum]MDF9810669.1 hypothetical protein [Aurantimicrobium minutum]